MKIEVTPVENPWTIHGTVSGHDLVHHLGGWSDFARKGEGHDDIDWGEVGETEIAEREAVVIRRSDYDQMCLHIQGLADALSSLQGRISDLSGDRRSNEVLNGLAQYDPPKPTDTQGEWWTP